MQVKKTISFLLLVTYLLTNNLWVIPFMEYYTNLDHIIKNYCVERDLEENLCMGSCYLNNKVKEAVNAQKYGEENSEKPVYNLHIVSPHIVTEDNFSTINSRQLICYFHESLNLITSSHDVPEPPPKC